MTVGSIISGGFALVRRRPAIVAVWALAYLLVSTGVMLASRPVFGSPAGLAGTAGQRIFEVNFSQVMLLASAFLIVVLILLAAAQRAVLHPERSAFAYIRLGMDELRLFALAGLLLLLVVAILFLVALVFGIIGGLLAVPRGQPAAKVLGLAELLTLVALVAWAQVRLSLAFPLTLLRGRFAIREGWRLTYHRFRSLLGAFLLLLLFVLVLSLVASAVGDPGYYVELARSGVTPKTLQAAGEHRMLRMSGDVTAMTVVGLVVRSVAAGVDLAVFGGALATAARDMVPDMGALEETFA